jgi:hypothetical protein
MPNRLAHETSPYLLQHANNPVDWYPWGPEALERARREDKPILLSIGYAACHWCHVMEHESFEHEPTAALMNEQFVNIKVDREERPDLDGIYMQAVQAMTGHGGWPMTVFLTPEGVPFYGGTYFPKDDRPGMGSFTRILKSVSTAYRSKPDDIARAAASVRELYASAAEETRSAGPLTPELLDRSYRAIADRYDERNGGFMGAPKFPQTMSLDFVLRHWARRGMEEALAIASHSFKQMARGGIYDQIGGGFARYTGRCRLARPALRENALRQRAADPTRRASLAGDEGPHCSPRRRGDGELGDPRDAVARRRVLLLVRRRQRRARRQVLRVERRGDRRDTRRRCTGRARVLGRHARRELRGAQHSVRRR